MSKSNDDNKLGQDTKYGSIQVDDWEDLKHESSETPPIPEALSTLSCGQCKPVASSVLSSLVFGWFEILLDLGGKKNQLDPEDLKLVPLPDRLATEFSFSVFEKKWEEEKARARVMENTEMEMSKSNDKKKKTKNKKATGPSLFKTLFRAYGKDFISAGVLKFVHDLLIFVGPQVLNQMIKYLARDAIDLGYGLSLTLFVTVAQLGMSLCLRHYFFRCYMTGLQFRTAVVLAVYKKALFLAASQRQTRSSGEITNLISVDAQRLQDMATYLHAIWYSFLQISLAIFFLWQQLGPSCLGGVAVIVIMMPITKKVARTMGRMQKKVMKAKDVRIEANNEVLQSMKVIKLQAWEKSFQDKIEDLRAKEMKQLFNFFLFNAFTIMMWTAVPLLVALATFATYVLSGNTLDVASALTALALFDVLRFPLFMLPQVINRLVEANLSLSRVRSFLLCDEHRPISPGSMKNAGVKIQNASFYYESKKIKPPEDEFMKLSDSDKKLIDSNWQIQLLKSQLADAESRIREILLKDDGNNTSDQDTYGGLGDSSDGGDASDSNLLSLRRVNFECKQSEFVVVVGPVGSGKTTFINTILGEINALSGSINVKGNLAFFSQSPFIMNETLKANIIFGNQDKPFDAKKYERAIETCALTHDLKILPNGDLCEIGEKGITLSGGQKARVAMARTVYHNADIYLLDDPLAAVDAHVGRHMFQKCIIEELLLQGNEKESKTKNTVILVTNALQYLNHPLVDRILVLKDGLIQESGSYEDLTQDPDSLFSTYLASFQESLTENSMKMVAAEDSDDNSEAPKLNIQNAISTSNTSLTALGDVTDEPEVSRVIAPKERSSLKATTAITQSIKERNDSFIGKPPKSDGKLMTDEFVERSTGHVSLEVYLAWAKAVGGTWILFAIVLFYLGVEAINVSGKWWLTYWGQHGDEKSQMFFLGIYAAINFTSIIAQFFRVAFVMVCGLRASKELFSRLLDTILRSPMSFFDTTPIGRIINRFAKDMYTVDEQLVATIRSTLSTLAAVCSTIVVIATAQPLFVFFLIPVSMFYMEQQKFFNVTYRELKRLDSVARSPLYALLGETLDGVSSIRAFNAQEHLLNRITGMLDQQQNAYYLTFTGQCWLAVRLELVGTMIIAFACLYAVIEHVRIGGDEAYASLAGLALSFALSVTTALNWYVRMASDLEANMVAVERVDQYCKLPSEASRTTAEDDFVDASWPHSGKIEFKNTQLRYREGLPLVLKGLDLVIPARSKVGVVGRTGAGKSTLMVALMRIVELYGGSILIDDIDIKTLGLSRVRSKIAVIPQDPVLFSGTVRVNLDPFDECEDERLYEVLRRVGLFLSSSSTNLEGLGQTASKLTPIRSLNDTVLEGGQNFSAGQRQLLVIARALLSEANIVIMDEATAAVDAETDAKIQKLMRVDFADATCITIAHRLNTIMDSDYILMMSDGVAAEFDSPINLMDKGGMFKDLVDAWEEDHE